MNTPRLEVRVDRIGRNTSILVERAARHGISVTGVTKAMLGSPALAATMIGAGAASLGDSRIENIERMRSGGTDNPMFLLRSPMPSQIERVVDSQVTSLNSEVEVIAQLSTTARSRGIVHDVVLMVESGDLREGLMPDQLHAAVREVLSFQNIKLRGLGTNLACRSGVAPDGDNMAQLGAQADSVEAAFGIEIEIVSGGNSANLSWLLDAADAGRVNNLRLGEAILLGRDPLKRSPIGGLRTDAVELFGEVIESIRKPTKSWGQIEQSAFGEAPPTRDRGEVWQTIVALGHQDTDPDGLLAPDGVRIVGASSDHLITETDSRISPGSEVEFQPNYSALLRSMTSPYVVKHLKDGDESPL